MKLKEICKFSLLLSVMIYARTYPVKLCNKLKIDGTWYDKDLFYRELNKASNLNVHKTSNRLFFSYSVPESSYDMDFRLGHYNLETKEYQTIAGIRGGCSIAIDQNYDDIYLGGSDGIYKYNPETKLADLYLERGRNIWSLFFMKNLFYISYPDQKLHIQFEGKFSRVREFENIEIDQFFVKSNNDMYYSNKSGFFRFSDEKFEGELVSEEVSVRQIVEDNEGNTYVCTNMGLYIFGKSGFNKILDVKNMYGLAFDGDNNMIISDDKYIIRLLKSNFGCRRRNTTSTN